MIMGPFVTGLCIGGVWVWIIILAKTVRIMTSVDSED